MRVCFYTVYTRGPRKRSFSSLDTRVRDSCNKDALRRIPFFLFFSFFSFFSFFFFFFRYRNITNEENLITCTGRVQTTIGNTPNYRHRNNRNAQQHKYVRRHPACYRI